MRLGGQISAAIEVIAEVEGRGRLIAQALKDWGNSHRFAGSADRAAIGNLVYDVFRKKRSLSWFAGSDDPRKLVFALLLRDWKMDAARLNETLSGDKFAPELLSDDEIDELLSKNLTEAPLVVQADLPDWLEQAFENAFDEEWVNEGRGLSERPALDMRVNTLKASREKVEKALSRLKPIKTPIALNGLRIKAGNGTRRLPNVQAEEGYQKGWFEIQDEGSQIAAELVFAQPGEQVLDYCAGAGGKTLALSAGMENKGQIHAFDVDRNRLAPIYERIKRAGCRNVQVHSPGEEDVAQALRPLIGRMSRVVVDAPCSGSGTWRRHPEAKWKLTQDALDQRVEEQNGVLEEASLYVKPGGYLIYITCSILSIENEERLFQFAESNPEYEIVSLGEVWQDIYGFEKPKPWSIDFNSITLTPASTGTDGFFAGVLWRAE